MHGALLQLCWTCPSIKVHFPSEWHQGAFSVICGCKTTTKVSIQVIALYDAIRVSYMRYALIEVCGTAPQHSSSIPKITQLECKGWLGQPLYVSSSLAMPVAVCQFAINLQIPKLSESDPVWTKDIYDVYIQMYIYMYYNNSSCGPTPT